MTTYQGTDNMERKPAITMPCLSETVELMASRDYKKRFLAEYYQLKIRYEKLKKFNTKIEAAQLQKNYTGVLPDWAPPHDCPEYLLEQQQRVMGEYLHILETRAEIEGIEL